MARALAEFLVRRVSEDRGEEDMLRGGRGLLSLYGEWGGGGGAVRWLGRCWMRDLAAGAMGFISCGGGCRFCRGGWVRFGRMRRGGLVCMLWLALWYSPSPSYLSKVFD